MNQKKVNTAKKCLSNKKIIIIKKIIKLHRYSQHILFCIQKVKLVDCFRKFIKLSKTAFFKSLITYDIKSVKETVLLKKKSLVTL